MVVDGTYQNDWVVKSDVKRGSDEVVGDVHVVVVSSEGAPKIGR